MPTIEAFIGGPLVEVSEEAALLIEAEKMARTRARSRIEKDPWAHWFLVEDQPDPLRKYLTYLEDLKVSSTIIEYVAYIYTIDQADQRFKLIEAQRLGL